MTRVLVIKTSSMGDIIHTLPALTDAVNAIPAISFDWVVEEAFAEIPKWHPFVDRIIPIFLRRFRKKPLQLLNSGELIHFFSELRKRRYDLVIDAQGLIKSAMVTRFSRGLRCGLNWQSAWEPLASLAYQKKIEVDPKLHAIKRMRLLFSKALSYSVDDSILNYGLQLNNLKINKSIDIEGKFLLFIHGTTWDTKEWPETYWIELAKIAAQNEFRVLLPWGNNKEEQRAKRIAAVSSNAVVLPRTSLTELANILNAASGVVSVDTGLGHLAAALNVPTVSLYGPTDPKEIGTQGLNQTHISVNFKCSPCWNQHCGYGQSSEVAPACFSSIPPTIVWEQLQKVLKN